MENYSESNLRTMFWKVADNWDLARLYHDLEDIKGQELTELELACLRGLLLYGDRKKVAAILTIEPEYLREILNNGLYLHIGKLTDTTNITSRLIPQLLADRGYQFGQNKLWLTGKKYLPGSIIAIAIGVLVNVFAGIISQNLVKNPQKAEEVPSPLSCQEFQCIPVPKGLFLYGGSTSWAPIRKVLEAELSQSQFEIQYQHPADGKPSSGKGVKMLLEGEIDIALISRPLTDKAISEAAKRRTILKEIKVARNAGAVIVSKNLEIPGLTVDELQKIYTGKITNWQQVGGPNLPIQPFIRADTLDGFTKPFLGEEVIDNLGKNVQKVKVVTTGIQQVSQTPGAIFLGSAGLMIKQCSVQILPIGDKKDNYTSPAQGQNCPYQLDKEAIRKNYPAGFTTFLSIVYKENDQRSKEAGETLAKLLLSEEGQKLIDGEADFVRIH